MKRAKSVIFIALIMMLMGTNISASESDNTDTNIQFTVEAILPDNQIDKNVTYYHLLLNETHTQEIKVKVINLKKDPITVVASANNARTNSKGVIEYGRSEGDFKASSQVSDFESIVSIANPRLKLESYESKEFTFAINLKDMKFEGIILGGLSFELEQDSESASGVSQTYSYNISTVLSQNSEQLKSSKTLAFVDIKPSVKDGYKYLSVSLMNDEPKILTNLKVDVKIYEADSETILYQKTSEGMEMAPHSIIDFNIETGKKNLSSGDYRYVIEASSFKQNWRWENTFSIDNETAQRVNEESINRVEIPQLLKYGFVISIIITLVNATLVVKESKKEEL